MRKQPEGGVEAYRIWKRFRNEPRWVQLRDPRRIARRASQRSPWLWALRDVSFTLGPGESLGVVGLNGSGKSTILRMIARVLYPYAGRIEATGRVGALIEVAGGLHPDLTGRENVQLYGALLGLGRSEVNASFDEILAFAGIEAAIDRQVKFYSSGMKLRLGFSVAAFLRPAILLVDEALAVGDVQFQRKCLERMHQTLDEGTTLIHVSHDMEAIKATCKRVIWLDQGVVKSDGPAEEVLGGYLKAFEGLSEEERNALVPRRR